MPKFILEQITTFRRHVEIEAESIGEALDKAGSDTDLWYTGTDTLDFETKFKPVLKRDTRK